MDDDVLARFEANRSRLFGLAYRMLGSAAEAEDVVQESYLRWLKRDAAADPVDVPEAWLTTVVTNLCLNQLGSARARRERYVGAWLPEPVLTGDGTLGPLETVEQRESVSLGLLVLSERLTPRERAVFVLREAFQHSYREIADILDVDEAHARQLHRRAGQQLDRPRRRRSVDVDEHARIVERFLAAALDGDVAGLEALLADTVVSWADGGGKAAVARRPVRGRDRVARYWLGLGGRPEAAAVRVRVVEVNGEPAAVFTKDRDLLAVVALEVAESRVTAVRLLASPAKLGFAASQLP
ncbi:RNA polymerase sigma factor SigJ [Micromonospora sp. NPDC047670]|uniref:RNA polymerase sigma factor SigJ n=1 Tax=Micromonospora sp. NPDC047670 TaxID=3364252 RepID=UPI00371FF1B6